MSDDGEEIDIGGFAADPVPLSYDKAAQAAEFDRAFEKSFACKADMLQLLLHRGQLSERRLKLRHGGTRRVACLSY